MFMAKPHEVDPRLIIEFFEDKHTQSEAFNYISLIRAYDRSKPKNESLLLEANNIALNMASLTPYDEVILDGKLTTSVNDIMLVTCLYLNELGIIPSYEK